MQRLNIIIPYYQFWIQQRESYTLYCPNELSHALYKLQQRIDMNKHFQQWLLL